MAISLPILITYHGLKKKSLSVSGAVLGIYFISLEEFFFHTLECYLILISNHDWDVVNMFIKT